MEAFEKYSGAICYILDFRNQHLCLAARIYKLSAIMHKNNLEKDGDGGRQ